MQKKEASDQKMQENKPVLELKNTGKKVYQKLKLKKSFFHCTLMRSGKCQKECSKKLNDMIASIGQWGHVKVGDRQVTKGWI